MKGGIVVFHDPEREEPVDVHDGEGGVKLIRRSEQTVRVFMMIFAVLSMETSPAMQVRAMVAVRVERTPALDAAAEFRRSAPTRTLLSPGIFLERKTSPSARCPALACLIVIDLDEGIHTSSSGKRTGQWSSA